MQTEDLIISVYGAARGRQATIKGDGAQFSQTVDLELKGLSLTGGGSGKTYYFDMPVAGNQAADVTLTPSAITGTASSFSASIYPTFLDGSPAGNPVAYATFAAGTQQTQSVSGMKGQQRMRLQITVPAGGTITFSQAEYNSL